MSARIGIIDLGTSNVNSMRRATSLIHAEVVITSDPHVIAGLDKQILPGIGHFQKAMEALENKKLTESLHEQVLIKKKPILGICLGMQVMAAESEEGKLKGLGW